MIVIRGREMNKNLADTRSINLSKMKNRTLGAEEQMNDITLRKASLIMASMMETGPF